MTRTLVDIILVILTVICVVVSRRETRHRLPSPLALEAVEALLLLLLHNLIIIRVQTSFSFKQPLQLPNQQPNQQHQQQK